MADLFTNRKSLIGGLAVQLFLEFETELSGPWGQLWPDEQAPYIRKATVIVDQLIACNYLKS